jgi:hypothetical protein
MKFHINGHKYTIMQQISTWPIHKYQNPKP